MGVMKMLHKSVLLSESINNLNIKNGGVYVDATLGFGGHSSEILKKNKKGMLICFDQDNEAINYSKEYFIIFLAILLAYFSSPYLVNILTKYLKL